MHDAHPADPECTGEPGGCSQQEYLGQRGPGTLESAEEHCIPMRHCVLFHPALPVRGMCFAGAPSTSFPSLPSC